MRAALAVFCLVLAPLGAMAQPNHDYTGKVTQIIAVADASQCPASRAPASSNQTGDANAVVVLPPQVVCMAYSEVISRCSQAEMSVALENMGNAGAALSDSGDLQITTRPDDTSHDFCNQIRQMNAQRQQFLRQVAVAQAHYEGALAAARASVAANPSDLAAQHELVVEIISVGDVELARGDLDKAQTNFEESLAIAQRLAASAPDNAGVQWDIYTSTVKLANLQALRGNVEAARAGREQGLAIAQRLATSNPQAGAWRRAVFIGGSELGAMDARRGDLPHARQRLDESLRLARAFAADQPGPDAQRDIGAVLLQVSAVDAAQNDLPAALQAAQESVILHRLAPATDAQGQHEICVALQQLAAVQGRQGDVTGAERGNTECLDISRRLAAANPRDLGRQRDVVIAAQQAGDACVAARDIDGARRAYEEGLNLARQLASEAPGDPRRQRDVWVSMQSLAANVPGSVSWHALALYMQHLDRIGALDTADRQWLDQARANAGYRPITRRS